MIRGRKLRVEVTQSVARYQLADGEPLDITHHGDHVTLSAGQAEERAIPDIPAQPRPNQPPGREPARRRVRAKTA